jgi:Asp/Glu/hydantoin racemase
VACFSKHSLVGKLRQAVNESDRPRRPVLGIFEASVTAATAYCKLVPTGRKWVVVTTAESWQKDLTTGVFDIYGIGHEAWDYRSERFPTAHFGGIETTGLTAGELHTTPKEEVDRRLAKALDAIIGFHASNGGKVHVVVLGCAGMAGWEEKVRRQTRREHGDTEAVLVIDPVKAGVGALQIALRAGY